MTLCCNGVVFCIFAGLLVLDDDEDDEDNIVDEHGQLQQLQLQQQQQQYPTSSRGGSMGRLNGRQMGHPGTGTGAQTTLVSSQSGTHHRTGMMMGQHVPHYQLPPTPPHHPVHPHLGYVHPHHLHVANNVSSCTKDLAGDEMDSDHAPTTLLKQTPSSSHKFIPQGNQTRSSSSSFSPTTFARLTDQTRQL